MRLRAWAALLALALLLPGARAGSEENPDITDGANGSIRDGAQDFVAAWFESHPSGILFTFKVREAASAEPNHGWAIGFDFGGARHIAVVAVDGAGGLRSCMCKPGLTKAGMVPDKLPDTLEKVGFDAGKPAYVTALIPYDAIPNLGPGAVLQNVGASTMSYTASGGWKEVDGNSAVDGYAVQRALLPPWASQAIVYGLVGLALCGVGAGATLLALRLRARRVPVAEGSAVSMPPQDAGDAAQRLRLQPPPR